MVHQSKAPFSLVPLHPQPRSSKTCIPDANVVLHVGRERLQKLPSSKMDMVRQEGESCYLTYLYFGMGDSRLSLVI